jgi:hypothetical protein
MIPRGESICRALGAACIVLALLVSAQAIQVHRVVDGRTDPVATCQGTVWTWLADLQNPPSGEVFLTTPGGAGRGLVVTVPLYRVRACCKGGDPGYQQRARSLFGQQLVVLRAGSLRVFTGDLETYLDDRYSFWGAIWTAIRDTIHTIAAFTEGFLDGCGRHGVSHKAVLNAAEEGFDAWGEVPEQEERERLHRLYHGSCDVLEMGLDSYLAPGGDHESQWVPHTQTIVAAFTRQPVIGFDVLPPGHLDAFTPIAPSSPTPPLVDLPKLDAKDGIQLSARMVAFRYGDDIAERAVSGLISRSGARVALRFGARVGGRAGLSLLFEGGLAKLEELLFRGAVREEMIVEFDQQLNDWQQHVQTAYDEELQESDQELEELLVDAVEHGRLVVVVK